MASRRETVIRQREDKLEAMRRRLRGADFDISERTQETLQRLLLDKLLLADEERSRIFSLENTHILKGNRADAVIYRDFFARCVQGTWDVTLRCVNGHFSFEFARA